MKLAQIQAPDTQLNMTPMIDIVFQLILFFLFNLRFKSLDWRIESSLPRAGPFTGPPVEMPPHLRVSLSRLSAEDPSKASTKIKFAGNEWIVPDIDRISVAERDALFLRIQARMEELRSTVDGWGEIDTPPPTGGLVPHGDVVRVLDSFIAAKFAKIDFQGAATPLPRR